MSFLNAFKTAGTWAVCVVALSVAGAGCFGSGSSGPTGPDLGVWKTETGGQSWVNQKAFVDGTKVSEGVAGVSISALTIDPQDGDAVYAGTKKNGVLYSYDGGETWRKFGALEAEKISIVETDPKNKCTLYTASENKLYKSKTCGRDWNVRYFHPNVKVTLTNLVIDWFNPTILYLGTDDGKVLRSEDEGETWEVVLQADAAIRSLALGTHDSRIVYAGAERNGLHVSTDRGATWVQIRDELKALSEQNTKKDGRRISQVIPDSVTAAKIYIVHQGGIAKTEDNGTTWKSLSLITDPDNTTIVDFAIDPADSAHLVYITQNAIVTSRDGGTTWEAKNLPTTGRANILRFGLKGGEELYLGATSGN